MEKRIIWPQIITGALALALGVVVYVLDRPASQTYFITQGASLYQKGAAWFGVFGNYLPDFLHAFAFCLITIGVMGGGRRIAIQASIFWLLVDGLFELGQHKAISKVIVHYIPDWFKQIPLLENTAAYFSHGRFDPLDLLSIALGVVAAYVLSRWKRFAAS